MRSKHRSAATCDPSQGRPPSSSTSSQSPLFALEEEEEEEAAAAAATAAAAAASFRRTETGEDPLQPPRARWTRRPGG